MAEKSRKGETEEKKERSKEGRVKGERDRSCVLLHRGMWQGL